MYYMQRLSEEYPKIRELVKKNTIGDAKKRGELNNDDNIIV